MLRALIVLCLVLAASASAAQCRVALALGQDVSSSVDDLEYNLQREGLAAALDSPEVRRAAITLDGQWIMIALYEWSGRERQSTMVGWTMVATDHDMDLLVSAIRETRRSSYGFPTALGYAMDYGRIMLRDQPNCMRRVLDISADGLSNEGTRPKHTHDWMAADGVVVNGLPILGSDPERLKTYFEQEVIFGTGAFIEPANGYDDYVRAIKRKLLRELAPLQLSWLER